MQNVYVWSRKIHRIALFFTVGLGLIQLVTGLMLKFFLSLPFLDVDTARMIHRTNSIFFAITFTVQMLTGLYMYLHPYFLRWRNSPKG